MMTSDWLRNVTVPDGRISAADLHVHSKHSDRPSEWFLRRIGAPECFVEPRQVYENAREQGMEFVTITDHNSIDGALSIADLPGTFLSAEMTTYFPEDRCKIHCLVMDVTEAQFADLDQVRENIYDFQQYLFEHDILHSVSHPLFSVNDKLTLEHVERLLLLFNRFEGINGTRHPRAGQLVNLVFRTLTPELIDDLANRYNIAPRGETPWEKSFTGGSDDHSGIYTASAYTVTPHAESVHQFVQHLRAGMHECAGVSGTCLKMAHSFYHIAYSYYKSRFLANRNGKATLLGSLLERAVEHGTAPRNSGNGGVLRNVATGIVWRWKKRKMNDIEQMLVDEFGELMKAKKEETSPAAGTVSDVTGDRRSFELACHVSQNLGYAFFRKFIGHLQQGSLIESLQTFASLGPVALSIAPYIAAFGTQHKDEDLLQRIAGRFPIGSAAAGQGRKAWITDTFDDADGIRSFVCQATRQARFAGHDIRVVTCEDTVSFDTRPDWCRSFRPIGSFKLPEYDVAPLSFPPFLEILEYLEREKFSEIIISTPGPLGLTALAAGRLLGLRVVGIHHVDYAAHVSRHTDDEAVGQIVSRYLQWFYSQMSAVFTFSQASRQRLAATGVNNDTLTVLPAAVDTRLFRADLRTRSADAPFRFVYVGRLAAGEHVDVLLRSFCDLEKRLSMPLELILVGEGPRLQELQRRCKRRGTIQFTGGQDELRRAVSLANADVFVFPSTTEAFSLAVMEAHASGLPAVVANGSAASEIVEKEETGHVVQPGDEAGLTEAMMTLCLDPHRARFAERAKAVAHRAAWSRVLDMLCRPPKQTDLPSTDVSPASACGRRPSGPVCPVQQPSNDKAML